MNILITSVGTRNKIIQYFKREINGKGKIIATDMSEYAPALYEADKYYIMPSIEDKAYIEKLIKICLEEKIDCLISLIDPELSLISKNRERFLNIGVVPLISDFDIVELAYDKYKMFEYLEKNGYKTPQTYIDKEKFYIDLKQNKIEFPVFVKPVKGSASLNTSIANSKEEIEILFKNNKDLMIQEFIGGKEIGADAYIDPISKKVVSIFLKEKIKMRAGETDKSKSIKNNKLFDLLCAMIEQIGYIYMIDIDLFEVNNEYVISEINPRFGGGYPHAYECGVNFMKMIVNSVNGIENKKQIGTYNENVYMMKYNEIKILK